MTLISDFPYRDIYLYVSFLRLFLMKCLDWINGIYKGVIFCTYSVNRGWIGVVFYVLIDKGEILYWIEVFEVTLHKSETNEVYQGYHFCRFREGVLTTFFMWNGRYHIKLQSCTSDSQKEAIMY